MSCRTVNWQCERVRTKRWQYVWCGVRSGSEGLSTEQPVRHNTGHQQSLPHTGYQHGTALGTRSVLQETSSRPGSGQSERTCVVKIFLSQHVWAVPMSESSVPLLCLVLYGWLWVGLVTNVTCYKFKFVRVWPAYLLLVQLEGGLDQIPQGSQLLLLLILSLFDLRENKCTSRAEQLLAVFT